MMRRDGKGRPYTYSLRATSREFYICVPPVAADVRGRAPCIMDEVERMEAGEEEMVKELSHRDGIVDERSLAVPLCCSFNETP